MLPKKSFNPFRHPANHFQNSLLPCLFKTCSLQSLYSEQLFVLVAPVVSPKPKICLGTYPQNSSRYNNSIYLQNLADKKSRIFKVRKGVVDPGGLMDGTDSLEIFRPIVPQHRRSYQ